jgi:hypothetical protein
LTGLPLATECGSPDWCFGTCTSPQSAEPLGLGQLHVIAADVDELDLGELQLRVGRNPHISRDPRCQVTLNRPAEARDLARLAYSSVQPRSEKRGYVELLGTIVDPGWLPTSLTCHRRVCTTSGHYARKSHDRNDRISVRAEPALAGLHQMESGGPQLWRVLANSWRASPVSWVVSTWLMRRAASGRNGTSSSPRT